jgi:hypothetical protein
VILGVLVYLGSPKYFKKVRISPSAAMKMVSPPWVWYNQLAAAQVNLAVSIN